MKRFLIAGNWKMNKTTAQAVHYVHELKAQKLTNPESVAIIAPFTQLEALKKELLAYCKERIGFLGPIEVIPGEMEMEALAAGALRVLNGEEQAKEFNVLPEGFSTKEEFDAFVKTQQ